MNQKSGKRAIERGNGAAVGATKKSKSGKRRKFKGTRAFKILRFALFALIIVLIVNIILDLIHKTPDKVSVVIGDKKIELVHDVIVDENRNVSMSIEDVKNIYDNNMYYSDNVLITTYNKHIAVLEMGKTTMKVNDVVVETKGTLKEANGTIYLPLSDMKDVYDFEAKYNKDTKVLSIDSKLVEKKEAVTLKNVNLKETTENFAKTIEKVKKANYVTVFGTEGKYTRVRTDDGNVGYVETKKLSEPKIVWETMDEDKLKTVTVLTDYSVVDSDYDVLTNITDYSIVTPNLFSIEDDGENPVIENKIDFTGNRFLAYKEWAEQSNVTICPTVTLNYSMNKLCSSYVIRSSIVNILDKSLVNNQLRMICIDFEEIDDVEGFYRFLAEMMPRFKCDGMRVLVKYNDVLNKDRLKSIVDYVLE